MPARPVSVSRPVSDRPAQSPASATGRPIARTLPGTPCPGVSPDLWERHSYLVGSASRRRPCNSLGIVKLRQPSESYILSDTDLVPGEVLEHRTDPAIPVGQCDLFQIDAIDYDATGRRLVEAHQYLGERRLAGSVLAYKGDSLARPEGDR